MPHPIPHADAIWAITVGAIYFGSLLAVAWAARVGLAWLMRRTGVDLPDVQAQAGPSRGSRKVFLLGSWRTEE